MGKDNQEEKEDKPKKAFSIKGVVWDDGGVDLIIQEYRKLGTGRGAPTLCGPLSPSEFGKALRDMGLNAQGVLQSISFDVGITKDLQSVKNADVIEKIEADLAEPPSEGKKTKKPVVDSDDVNDIPDSLDEE